MNARHAVATFRGHRVPNLRIIQHKTWWFALSGFVILLSVGGLVFRGLNYSIDFTGGAQLQYDMRTPVTVPEVQSVLARFGRADSEVQILNGTTVSIRTTSLTEGATATPEPSASASPSPSASAPASPSASPAASASPSAATATGAAEVADLKQALARQAGISVDDISVQDVGPTWGGEISRKAIEGLIIVLVAIAVYISFRFEWKMAIGAMAALIHDVTITAGVYALVGREVSPATVIAILTILGFSLYDTVVIFDKVRENTESPAMLARDTYEGVANTSMNQVLMRSVNTSLVVILPILSLLLFGGSTLKDFAFAMLVGVMTGAYSSIFVATPILVVLKEREPRYAQLKAKALVRPGVRELRPAAARAELGDGGEVRTGPAPAAVGAASRSGTRTGSGQARPRPKSKRKPPAKRRRR